MKFTLTFIVLWLTLSVVAGHGRESIVVGGLDGLDQFDNTERFPVLLALSGGGARGLAAIGILRAFEEKGVTVAAITGTSIGGIIGGLYACGYSPDELERIIDGIDLGGLFSNRPARRTMFLTQREERNRHLLSLRLDGLRPILPRALTAGQKLTAILTTLTTKAGYHSAGDFNRLPIPFKTISTDIVSGREIILDRGSLADAMRATIGFPLAFTPLDKDGQLLMDGGLVTPIPVALVRTMNDSVTFTVAVNTASPLRPRRQLTTAVDIANQATSIMTADKLTAQVELADYTVAPPMGDIGMTDFKYKDSLIEIGYRAGLRAADSIIVLLRQQEDNSRFSIMKVRHSSGPLGPAQDAQARLGGVTMSRKQLVAHLKSLLVAHNLFRLEVEIETTCSSSVSDREVTLHFNSVPAWPTSETRCLFEGNRIYNDSTLTRLLLPPDSLLTPHALRQGVERVLELYRHDGHDLVYARDVTVDTDEKLVSVTLDEAIITSITVADNQRTRDWFVLSSFPSKVGEPYSTRRASRGLANIYGTDLFNRVTIDLLPSDNGAAVVIGVEEKHNRQLRLGWHWDDDYQSEEFLELLDDNVLGVGLEYLLHARYARERQDYFAGFKADRIISTYLTARLRAYHTRLHRSLFDAELEKTGTQEEIKLGAEVRFGQQIARFGTVNVALVAEQVEYRDNGVSDRFGLRIFKVESLVETFDRIPFPESGKKHLFELKFAGKYLGGEVEYTRFYSSLEAYWAVGSYLNYHPRLAVGLSRSGLPASERFYLGGTHSFAGFRTHQLTGDKVLKMSHEIRVKLPFRLYLSLRYDVGEVYNSADQMKLSRLRHGLGVIAALDSPIGPFEFGYGVASDGFERYYLNVGLAF